MMTDKRASYFLLALFFFSGLAGLIHQILWIRSLHLVLGATVLAISVVTACYMGGLAGGSYLFGRWGEKFEEPLRGYGWMEIGIGLYALALPTAFDLLAALRYQVLGAMNLGFWGTGILYSLLAALALLIPTALMGGTLPVLAPLVEREKDVSWLYTVNTLGAAAGVFLSGFAFLPLLGLKGGLYGAAATNLVVGAIALWVTRGKKLWKEGEKEGQSAAGEEEKGVGPLPEWEDLPLFPLLALVFCTGFASLVLEVAWARVIALILGSSIYAATLMLATFLVGLALGSWLGTVLFERPRQLTMALCAFLFLSAGAALATISFYSYLPYLFLKWYESFRTEPGMLAPVKFSLTALVILPVSVFLGAVFPLALKAYLAIKGHFARSTGTLYAVNTLGAILGALLGGFFLIAIWGIKAAILVAVFFLILAAFLASVYLSTPLRTFYWPALVGLLVFLFFFPPQWKDKLMVSGTSYYAPVTKNISKLNFQSFQEGFAKNVELLYYQEGLYSTVSVEKHRLHNTIFIKNDGKVEGSIPAGPGGSKADMSTQLLLAHLPLIFQKDAREVLVVGLGSGVTAGAVLKHKEVHLDCVEIEGAVVEALRKVEAFHPYMNGFFHKKDRVSLYVADARGFLNRPGKDYDVIISQPSDPWITGSAGLFTEDFFRQASRRLSPQGLFCQWIQLYHLSPRLFKSLVQAFKNIFPNTYIFKPKGSQEVLLLGSRHPFFMDPKKVDQAFSHREISRDLARADLGKKGDFYLLFLMGPEELSPFLGEIPANTDNNALIELEAPLMRYSGKEGVEIFREILRQGANIEPYIKEGEKRLPLLLQIAAAQALRRRFSMALPVVRTLYKTTGDMRMLRFMATIQFLRGDFERAQKNFQTVLAQFPRDYATLFNLACLFTYRGKLDQAKTTFDQLLEYHPRSREVRMMKNYQHAKFYGDAEEFERLQHMVREVVIKKLRKYLRGAEKMLETREEREKKKKSLNLLVRQIEFLLKRENLEGAQRKWKELHKRAPQKLATTFLRGWILAEKKKYKEALPLVKSAGRSSQAPLRYVLQMARILEEAGYPGQALEAYQRYARARIYSTSPQDMERAEYFRLMGDLEGAIDAYVEAIQVREKEGKESLLLYYRALEICARQLQITYQLIAPLSHFKNPGVLPLEKAVYRTLRQAQSRWEERYQKLLVFCAIEIRKKHGPKEQQTLQKLRSLYQKGREVLRPSPARKKVTAFYMDALYKLGRWEEARRHLSKFLEENPRQWWALLQLGRVLAKQGKRDDAEDIFRNIISSQAPFKYKRQAGQALMELGD